MIVKPENMDFTNKNIIMIISGLPGVGKTTLALSAPDVVLIDADEGMARVKPEHRKDSSMVKTYEELLEDIRQCWAEAKILFDKGALVPCADRLILQEIQDVQSSAVEDDYRVGLIEAYLEDKRETCVLDLWRNALENPFSKPAKKESNEIGLIMQSMRGWEKYPKAKKMKDFGVQKVWVRGRIQDQYDILP